jgi:hypothetical protein
MSNQWKTWRDTTILCVARRKEWWLFRESIMQLLSLGQLYLCIILLFHLILSPLLSLCVPWRSRKSRTSFLFKSTVTQNISRTPTLHNCY